MPHALRRSAAPARRRRAATGALRSYAAFVDAALFHPRWGYYSTGGVRFGEGGHYDTYPLALSPYFGRMVAGCAFRLWRRLGTPKRFEICELGAGNGQLCLDTLLWIDQRADARADWRAFAAATRYRIVERSPGLVARQRQQLGPLASRVTWTRADFAQRPPRQRFGDAGMVIANEVLDCLPHHKLVHGADGGVAVTHVEARLRGRALTDAGLAAAMASPTSRDRVRFREVDVALDRLPGLEKFARRYYADWLKRRNSPPLFVATRMPTLMASTARCYARGEAIWVDYGSTRAFHLRAPERRKAFAGPPRTGRGLFDAPGADDITFMVDFTLAADAAREAGWRVAAYGPQALLAARGGVRFDAAAVERIIQQRALVWLLAFAGVGPERDWRRGAVGWTRRSDPARVSVRDYARRSVREFLRQRGATFQVLITRR
jgi:SAM-dependent MidA family methyltransferase